MTCKNNSKECDGCMKCYIETEYCEDDSRIYCIECLKELDSEDENVYNYYGEHFCEECAKIEFKEDLEKNELVIKKVFTDLKKYDILIV